MMNQATQCRSLSLFLTAALTTSAGCAKLHELGIGKASEPVASKARPKDAPLASLDDRAPALLAAALRVGDAAAVAAWPRLPAYQALLGAFPQARRQQAEELLAQHLSATPPSTLATELAAAAAFADGLRRAMAPLEAFELPRLSGYLPGTNPLGRVRLAPYLGRVAAGAEAGFPTRLGDVLIDPTSPALQAMRPDALNAYARELAVLLFKASLDRELPDPPTDGNADDDVELLVLHSFQRDGLTAWVGAQGLAYGSLDDAARATLDREVAATRFNAIDAALRAPDASSRWRAIKDLEEQSDALSVAGAYAASVIESTLGHAALVATVRRGGLAFWRAYLATEPGALLLFHIPGATPVSPETSDKSIAH